MGDGHQESDDRAAPGSALLDRLRRRKLVQWTLAYAAAAFAILQFVDILGNRFDWPAGVVRSAIVLLCAGLPLTAVLAWYHGERGRQRVGGGEVAWITVIVLAALAGVSTQLGRGGAGEAVATAGVDLGGAGIVAVPAELSSVAVLPFANVGGDPEREYFSDGLTDELIGALSRVEGLKVAARTSAFRFKGENPDARDVGRLLGVAAVVDGSVRIIADRLRVSAQLVGTTDGYQLWSETYDGELGDVFAIQDEISRAIVEALRVRLGPLAAGAASEPPDLEAYELYLRGRWFANRRSDEALERATSFFERAIETAPGYAAAHAGLADAYLAPRRSRPAERFRLGKQAALRALELDSTLAAAHTSLGWIAMWYDRDWAAAGRHLQRAIELDPGYLWAHQWYSAYLSAIGRSEDARQSIRRAYALDPLSLAAMTHVGTQHLFLRQYDDALRYYRAALEFDADFGMARGGLARALLALGRYDEAIEALRHEDDDWVYAGHEQRALLGYALALSGASADARALLDVLRAEAATGYVAPPNIAIIAIGLGETRTALEWLERVVDDRGAPFFLLADPAYDPLRDEPRFRTLLQRVGLR